MFTVNRFIASHASKPLTTVWVQLYVDGEEIGSPNYLGFIKGSKKDVLGLKKSVKKDYAKKLEGISVAELMVYSWNGEPMVDPEEIITTSHGGDSWNHAIRVAVESRATKRLKSTDEQPTTERRDPAVTHEGFSIENQPRVPAQHSSLATALHGLRPDAPLPYPPVLRKADHTKATVEPIQTTAKVCISQSFGWFVACVLAP
jgi:hypothetical protein